MILRKNQRGGGLEKSLEIDIFEKMGGGVGEELKCHFALLEEGQFVASIR